MNENLDPMLPRWQIRLDQNLDGVFSVSDVWLWIKWLYFAPGDAIIFVLSRIESTRTFFELSPDSYGNWFSAVVGTPFALFAIVTIWAFAMFGAEDTGARRD